MIELDEGDFEAVESGSALYLADPVTTVEIKQAEGLLSIERKAALVEGVSLAVANQLGIASGGPAIRVMLAREGGPSG